jgi:hypothetical protein
MLIAIGMVAVSEKPLLNSILQNLNLRLKGLPSFFLGVSKIFIIFSLAHTTLKS